MSVHGALVKSRKKPLARPFTRKSFKGLISRTTGAQIHKFPLYSGLVAFVRAPLLFFSNNDDLDIYSPLTGGLIHNFASSLYWRQREAECTFIDKYDEQARYINLFESTGQLESESHFSPKSFIGSVACPLPTSSPQPRHGESVSNQMRR